MIAGLVLGAGASSRLGRPKQLLPYRGTTLLGWVVAQANASVLNPVVVVVGGSADEVRQQVEFGRARVVDNPAFGTGCASSYRAGLGALDEAVKAVVIVLGDQPAIDPQIIGRLVERWSGEPVALASYEGRLGHPMLFDRALFPQLAELHGDKAAWKLVDAAGDRLVVEMDRPFPPDVNTPADAERLQGTA